MLKLRRFLFTMAAFSFVLLLGCSNSPSLNSEAEIRAKIQSFDVATLTQEALDAIEVGCAASTTDLEDFVAGFLKAIDADTSFATDANVQDDIDNLEQVDLGSLTDTCS